MDESNLVKQRSLVDQADDVVSPGLEAGRQLNEGVSVSAGVFPAGWRDRLVVFETPGTEPGRGLCLEPHDCILAKLVRFDEKNLDFAVALVRAGLIDLDTLAERAGTLRAHPAAIDHIRTWINAVRTR